MDSVSHAAWGATIIRKFPFVWWAVLSGALPDIIAASYGFLKFRGRYVKVLDEFARLGRTDDAYMRVYYWSHSLLPITLVAVVIALVSPAWLVVAVPYYLHIFMDIPTHRGIWATRPFYPLSDFRFEGHDWWTNKWASIGNWVILIVVNVLIVFT